MSTITFITHDGNAREVEFSGSTTLMQLAVDNGIDEILAECGGAMSCGTCHCYIDDKWIETIGRAADAEKSMLEFAMDPTDNSRLSCQIDITDEHDGLVVHLPTAQY